ncbi:hypothetical protein HMPREF9018_0761 [Prevotella amnii CRIS 21A-A]|uniref:Putative zinc-ribbon domain-containing protein n=1 Tax=Prevotella amnii CRIS 21A-A TaxID=679191 RepID=E1GVG0_9BACT|nr:zinc ribbon domain-containing protein [Prevotella amnii]EFN91372.1 hypothetical protein HMPREF9018_0761 [Prevotella amnii CRIS 21A-A]
MIIKCPECGHQVSDKAPICPNCGVEIAGNIIKCFHCGKLYIKEEKQCPFCHYVRKEKDLQSSVNVNDKEQEDNIEVKPNINLIVNRRELDIQRKRSISKEVTKIKKTKKYIHKSLIIAIMMTIITSVILFFTYTNISKTADKQEYEIALKEKDSTLFRQFLGKYPKSSIKQKEIINSSFNKGKYIGNNEKLEEIIDNSTREELLKYLDAHPKSPYRTAILSKIDEMDWQKAILLNTKSAYLHYMAQHPNGLYKLESHEILNRDFVKIISEEEKKKAFYCVRQLLVGINTRNKNKINSVVETKLKFQGAAGSTSKDIIKYMNDKLYQADVKTINWHLSDFKNIIFKEGNDSSVQLKIPAKLIIDRKGGKGLKRYLIKATVKSGKIRQISWS